VRLSGFIKEVEVNSVSLLGGVAGFMVGVFLLLIMEFLFWRPISHTAEQQEQSSGCVAFYLIIMILCAVVFFLMNVWVGVSNG